MSTWIFLFHCNCTFTITLLCVKQMILIFLNYSKTYERRALLSISIQIYLHITYENILSTLFSKELICMYVYVKGSLSLSSFVAQLHYKINGIFNSTNFLNLLQIQIKIIIVIM